MSGALPQSKQQFVSGRSVCHTSWKSKKRKPRSFRRNASKHRLRLCTDFYHFTFSTQHQNKAAYLSAHLSRLFTCHTHSSHSIMSSVNSSQTSSPVLMPAPSPISPRSSPRPSRQFRYRHRSRHNAVGNSDAYDNSTSHVHPPIAAAIQELQALQAEGTGSRIVNPLYHAHMQAMRGLGRHRTHEEVRYDTTMRQSRAANEYLARLGLTLRIEPRDLPGLQTRLQGFDF